jgi:O-antigen/teichoic acid export membrane protein
VAEGRLVNTSDEMRLWGGEDRQLSLVARNLSTRYLAIAVDGAIGLVLMPFNVSHLGKSAYGLWALAASVTIYLSILDLGYGGALVKFVAQYRAWRNRQALNEVLSTMFVVFTAVGLVTFVVTAGIAWQFARLFNVTPDQVRTGQHVLLVIGAFIAVRFAASIFGAVVYGFQRFYLNNLVSIATSFSVAAVNVIVLQNGGDLVTLVVATTAVRVLSLGAFVLMGYLVYPGLQVTPSLFRRERLREVTGFSVYIMVLDWSARLNYQTDALVIGAMLSTTAVAIWTVGQRLAEITQQLTNQLSDTLFPLVVDSDAVQRADRLRVVLVQGTRLSLALAVPACVGLAVMARPLITAWVGRDFGGSATVAQLLLAVVLVRVATGTSNVVLKGGDRHRLLAFTNSTTAIVNILLSILLIRSIGLPGVALGTLVPVTCAAMFVIFPAACRRVGLGIGAGVRQAVLPGIWPAVAPLAILWFGQAMATTLHGIAALLLVSGLAYEMVFFGVALSSAERQFYWMKVTQLIGRRWRVSAAA